MNTDRRFRLVSDFQPAGDQPQAIAELTEGIRRGERHQVLLGATGTGKTFTMAHVIANVGKPTLVLSHNKTLAAQLYGELKALFPQSAVEYFVSYYDYYQPEAYVPSSDMFIEKDSQINEQIDKLRHAATRSLLERPDVIIVASVSCIYGIGSKEAYDNMLLMLRQGQEITREQILDRLVDILYDRNDIDFHRGTFRARGDVIEVFPAHEDDRAYRIELFGDEVERLSIIDPLRGKRLETMQQLAIYPASHYVTPASELQRAMQAIEDELEQQLQMFRAEGKLLEAQRLEERTRLDLEMIAETGRCKGIENYSRHLTGRAPGEPPPTLLEYFPKDWLIIIDESHVSIPQVGAMYKGDRSRKETLVNYGFRLPSAMDNRPLRFIEFEHMVHQTVYVSATPGPYELGKTEGVISEQIIRPTGLLDPEVDVRPAKDQVDDLYGELRATIKKGGRALVTVLTKRMAQELTSYYQELGLKARYLHADIETLERMQIIRDLRLGEFDVLVGINLLREGLDIPEVSLVAVLDADKEGFLRNRTSLIQTIGRAARNSEGRVILYADVTTKSMTEALEETNRRRQKQMAYNVANNITPTTIRKAVHNPLAEMLERDEAPVNMRSIKMPAEIEVDPARIPSVLARMRQEMKAAAGKLEFERAAELRDQIKDLEQLALQAGVGVA